MRLRTGAIGVLSAEAGLYDSSLLVLKLLGFRDSSLLAGGGRRCGGSRVVHGCSNPLLKRRTIRGGMKAGASSNDGGEDA